MAYNEQLAKRVRALLADEQSDVREQRMFGGLAFMLRGNMCVGVSGDDLMVRLDPTETEAMLARPHARIFDMTGRPMRGWVLVGPDGVKTKRNLEAWVTRGRTYAVSLPPK